MRSRLYRGPLTALRIGIEFAFGLLAGIVEHLAGFAKGTDNEQRVADRLIR